MKRLEFAMRKTKQINRSTRRTRAAIQSALMHAIEQKPVSSVTVQEIIDEANVCRTTFYAHFRDINDLVETVGNEIIDEVGSVLEKVEYDTSSGYHFPTIRTVVEIYSRHSDTIRLLNSPNGDPSFNQRMQDKIYEVTRTLRKNYEGTHFQEDRHRLYSDYVISGGISVLNDLLLNLPNWDPDMANELLGRMAVCADQVFIQEKYPYYSPLHPEPNVS